VTAYRQPHDIAEAQAAIDAGLVFLRGGNGKIRPARVWQGKAGDWWQDYLIPSDFEAGQ
jgi:hypothetical protein